MVALRSVTVIDLFRASVMLGPQLNSKSPGSLNTELTLRGISIHHAMATSAADAGRDSSGCADAGEAGISMGLIRISVNFWTRV